MPWRRWIEETGMLSRGLKLEDRGSRCSILDSPFSMLEGGLLMLSLIVVLCSHMLVVGVYQAVAAEATTLEQLVAGAKKEGEVTLIPSASTFGGKKGFAELEAAFNKRYGLTSKVNLAPGPSFP